MEEEGGDMLQEVSILELKKRVSSLTILVYSPLLCLLSTSPEAESVLCTLYFVGWPDLTDCLPTAPVPCWPCPCSQGQHVTAYPGIAPRSAPRSAKVSDISASLLIEELFVTVWTVTVCACGVRH